MRDSVIRHIAASAERSLVAAAFFEATVQLWSCNLKQQLCEFETVLDFGGRRLALTHDGTICVAGSWKRGLAAYSAFDGTLLWHRKDLNRVQRITLGALGKEVYCGREEYPLEVIETKTGRTRARLDRTSGLFASQFRNQQLVVRQREYRVQGESEFGIPAMSFALLDAAFSPEALCISESNAGIRCFDLAKGNLLWHHKTLPSSHLVFNVSDKKFYSVTTRVTAPQESSLIRLASSLLDCSQIVSLGQCSESSFTPSGESLVTARGDVYECVTGTLLARLDFPQQDYPEP